MEAIGKVAARVAEQQIEMRTPSTIPASIADFDWQFETGHPEQVAALATTQRFLAEMRAKAPAWAKERERIRLENEKAEKIYFARVDAGERPKVPNFHALPESPGRWLSLLGKSGRGKTHLARKAAVCIGQTLQRGYFYRWTQLIEDCRNGQRGAVIERVEDHRFMVIDDIGAGYDTDYSDAVLAELLDRRMGRYTILTSNLSLEQLGEIDTRIASRLIRAGNEIFTFREIPDYSLK